MYGVFIIFSSIDDPLVQVFLDEETAQRACAYYNQYNEETYGVKEL